MSAFMLVQGQGPVGAGLQEGMVDLNDLWMSWEELGNLQGGQIVPFHSDLKREGSFRSASSFYIALQVWVSLVPN